jgi:1,4-dihydroxy-2-naphthoate octaprenyltransferase
VATLIPLSLGGAVAAALACWDTMRFGVVLVASFLVHLCTNLGNDYFEYATGADDGDSIGGSRVLQEGKITLAEIGKALVVLYVLALVCGLWIVWASQVWWLIVLMLFAFFSSVFYTAPPIRYGYRGLGELFVGVNMGPVMVVGTAAALTGQFVSRAFWLSIPIGIMVALILYYQSLSDIEADRAAGKITVAVRLGKPTALWGVRFFMAAALASITLLVAAGLVHVVALASLATLLLGLKIDRIIRATADWKDLHDQGSSVRLFYLANGTILVLGVIYPMVTR